MTKELFGIGKCGEIENMHELTINNLKTSLYNLNAIENIDSDTDFNHWYQEWKKYNE